MVSLALRQLVAQGGQGLDVSGPHAAPEVGQDEAGESQEHPQKAVRQAGEAMTHEVVSKPRRRSPKVS